jgi:hypothetical protein
MESIDFNIEHYTLSECLIILGLDTFDEDVIVEKTQTYMDMYEQEGNTQMVVFFQDMQNRLLHEDGDVEDVKTKQWYQTANALEQTDSIQRHKITDRKNKINVYSNQHVPMNREQLGLANTVSVPVSQDTLNPNLKNITSRYINIDSQYRQSTNGQDSSSTDFTMDLSESLNNVLSMKLYSIQIPYTWYAVDENIGNTTFWVVFDNNLEIAFPVVVKPGNYTPDDFVEAVNNCFDPSSGWNMPLCVNKKYPMSYSKNTGKISIQFSSVDSWTNKGNTYYVVSEETQIMFFDVTGYLHTTNGTNINATINNTLGWLMGYRLPYITILPSYDPNVADTLIDLYGPRYLILAIDDFNQNHINNGLITITEVSKNIKLPSYYVPTMPVKYTDPKENNLSANMATAGDNGELLMDKLNLSNKRIAQILPTAPRILTQAQIYSINEIMKNNEQNTQYKNRAPSSSDTFALLPVKHTNEIGSVMIELTSSLQENKRVYFGPVNIDRMRIRWYDDKGNILNMNGADWSITLIAEILYQY